MPRRSDNENQLFLSGMKEAVAATVRDTVRTAVKEAFRNDGQSGSDPSRELTKYPLRMRVGQVATYLNCSEQHVRNLVECGLLKGINLSTPGKPRAALRIFRESVADYEAKQNEGNSL